MSNSSRRRLGSRTKMGRKLLITLARETGLRVTLRNGAMNAQKSAGLLVAAFLVSQTAHAGRPLQTEDAGVLERGACEIELAVGRERADVSSTTDAGRAQFGCGIGFRSQVALAFAREHGGGDRSDLAAVVGKTWLRELTEEQTGITLAWSAGVVHPRGGGTERDAYEIRAVVTHPAGPWLLHGNLGWLRSETEHRDGTVWGAAVERTGLLGPIDAMLEFFGASSEKRWANAGLRWNVAPGSLSIDGSYGRQTGSAGSTLVTLGMKLAF